MDSIKSTWIWIAIGLYSSAWILGYLSACSAFIQLSILAFLKFIFLPADGDLTLLFLEKFGKSAKSLEGKVIWITGASTGIGKACALSLAKAKCRLVLSARSKDKLEQVKEDCVKLGNLCTKDVMVLPFDMVDYDMHQTAFSSVMDHFGQLDILLSNAGSSQRAKWESIETKVDKELFDLNVFSCVSLARIVTKHFIAQRNGHHVVVSSVVGKIGLPLSSSYCASKFALQGYFESLRAERAIDGIGITILNVGPVESNLMDLCFTDTAGKRGFEARTSKLMPAERCASLISVAAANRLSEVWIAEHPALAVLYLNSWFPSLFKWAMSFISLEKWAAKTRDGK